MKLLLILRIPMISINNQITMKLPNIWNSNCIYEYIDYFLVSQYFLVLSTYHLSALMSPPPPS